ncbi:hypothetical protein RUND412_007017 [Rhizina undulata]
MAVVKAASTAMVKAGKRASNTMKTTVATKYGNSTLSVTTKAKKRYRRSEIQRKRKGTEIKTLLHETDMDRLGFEISKSELGNFGIEGIERNSRKNFLVHLQTPEQALQAATQLSRKLTFQRTDPLTRILLPAESISICTLRPVLDCEGLTIRVHCALAISDKEFKKALHQHFNGNIQFRRCKIGSYYTNVMLFRIYGKVNIPRDETNLENHVDIPLSGRTVIYEIENRLCFECRSSEHGVFDHFAVTDAGDEEDDVTVESEKY